jgi:hypothetical protein
VVLAFVRTPHCYSEVVSMCRSPLQANAFVFTVALSTRTQRISWRVVAPIWIPHSLTVWQVTRPLRAINWQQHDVGDTWEPAVSPSTDISHINTATANNIALDERFITWRMASSGMLYCVALVRTEVSEELSSSIIRVTRIGELET